MILYEYPFNERVRTFLRLEDLFERLYFFIQQEDSRQHHVALSVLFDLLDSTARTDLKTDLIQDLDKQRLMLSQWRAHPNVDVAALDSTLTQIDATSAALMSISGKVGQSLRNDDWLNMIRSRIAIPGGACEFDLPSYYLWQKRPVVTRQEDLNRWCQVFKPLYDALELVLRLLRESASFSSLTANGGTFQEMLSGQAFRLLRLHVAEDLAVFPEVSANKYMVSIRFFKQDKQLTALPSAHDIPFELALCNS